MTTEKRNKQVALEYARTGWHVFPLHYVIAPGVCSCSKGKLCTQPGKHPMTKNGLKDATTNEEVIDSWWTKNPHANIGIRTGTDSGIIVLDIDPRHEGNVSLAQLEQKHGNLPFTAEVLTGGGGRHLFFKHPGGIVRSKAGFAPGLDLRADGGYVVAPPSNHISGRCYQWK